MDEQLSIDIEGLAGIRKSMYLNPAFQRDKEWEWLGIVRRADGDVGAIGRNNRTHVLFHVTPAGALRSLPQRAAEEALRRANATRADPALHH